MLFFFLNIIRINNSIFLDRSSSLQNECPAFSNSTPFSPLTNYSSKQNKIGLQNSNNLVNDLNNLASCKQQNTCSTPRASTTSATSSVGLIIDRFELGNENQLTNTSNTNSGNNLSSNGVPLSSSSSGRSLNATNRMLAAICCVFLLLEVKFCFTKMNNQKIFK